MTALIYDIIVLGIFIYLSLLVNGNIQLTAEKQEKFNAAMERNGSLIRIAAYGGTVLITILILMQIFR